MTLNNVIIGNGGLNDLFGFGGNDTLKGGDGDGSDLLNGGTGNDRMIGEGGNDIYVVDSTKDIVVEAANQGARLGAKHRQLHARRELEGLISLGIAKSRLAPAMHFDNSISGNSGTIS